MFRQQPLQEDTIVVECQIFWNLLQGKEPGVRCIIGGLKLAGNGLGKVNHQVHIFVWVLNTMCHIQQTPEPDLQPGLLTDFTDGSLLRCLTIFQKSGGETPTALPRLDSPLDQQHLTLAHHQSASSGGRGPEDHITTAWAGLPLAAKELLGFQSGAAVDAEGCRLSLMRVQDVGYGLGFMVALDVDAFYPPGPNQ